MAKTQKFSDELLLDAVVRYAEICHTKIKTTELADWARNNIEGLEEVRDYHFNRTMRVRNVKTGKLEEQKKECTKKIEEINNARSLTAIIGRNALLQSSSIDDFFNMSTSAQRKTVAEARASVEELKAKNNRLTIDNQVLKKSNKELKEYIERTDEILQSIQKKQKTIEKQINYIIKHTDESERKKMLEKIGIGDGYFDINKYYASINEEIGEVFNISETLRKYNDLSVKQDREETLINDILSGIKPIEE